MTYSHHAGLARSASASDYAEALSGVTPSTRLPLELNGEETLWNLQAFRSKRGEEAIALHSAADPTTEISAPLVRIHSGCITGDVLHSLRCDCQSQLKLALDSLVGSPGGLLIYFPAHEGRGIGLFQKVRAYALQDHGLDTIDANIAVGAPADARNFGFAASILSFYGITSVRLMTNNPDKLGQLNRHGINVVEQVPLRVPPNRHSERYLHTKRVRCGHEF